MSWSGKSEFGHTTQPARDNAFLGASLLEKYRRLAPMAIVPGVGPVPSGPSDQFRSGLRYLPHASEGHCQQTFTSGSGNASTEAGSLQRPMNDAHYKCPPSCCYACSCKWPSADHYCHGWWKVHRLPCPWSQSMPHDIVKPERREPSNIWWPDLHRRESPVGDHEGSMRQTRLPFTSVRSKPPQSRSEDCSSFPEWDPEQERLLTSQAMQEFDETRPRNGEQSAASLTNVASLDRLKEEEDKDSEALPRGPSSRQDPSQARERSDSPGLFIHEDDPGPDPMDIDPEDQDEDASDYDQSDSEDLELSDLEEGDSFGEEEPDEEDDLGACCCPINLQCPRRLNNHIDCRTLVLEWEWRERADRELMDLELIPEKAEFITVARVRDMLRYCMGFENKPGNTEAAKKNFWCMVRWAVEALTKSVSQELLDSTNILPCLQLFLEPARPLEHLRKHTPLNLIEDVTIIFRKWTDGDLLADANRGLRLVCPVDGAGKPRYKIDETWPHRKRDKFYGHGHLVNGQKWVKRIHMSRDGAHGPLIAGISGSTKYGARGVVMGFHDDYKKRYYADVDMGDTIHYIGTALPDLDVDDEPEATNIKDTAASRNRGNRPPTKNTRCLLKSIETGRPVRVFRSYKLAKIVRHKPVEGYRYDGLYRVTRAKLLKKDRQIFRFTMKRLRHNDPASGGQGPLRGVRRPALPQ